MIFFKKVSENRFYRNSNNHDTREQQLLVDHYSASGELGANMPK